MGGDSIFLGLFKDVQSLRDSFEITDDQLVDVYPLLAWYDLDGYEGDAYVLFSKGGGLYEVHGSHCSCYGLERQWKPEETTIESIRHRVTEGKLGTRYDHRVTFRPQLERLITLLEGERDETTAAS